MISARLDVYVHLADTSDSMIAVLTRLTEQVRTMSAELEILRTEVAENNTVIGSAIALLNGLKQRLDDALASNDPPAALAELSASLDTTTNALAAAVAANTPAA